MVRVLGEVATGLERCLGLLALCWKFCLSRLRVVGLWHFWIGLLRHAFGIRFAVCLLDIWVLRMLGILVFALFMLVALVFVCVLSVFLTISLVFLPIDLLFGGVALLTLGFRLAKGLRSTIRYLLLGVAWSGHLSAKVWRSKFVSVLAVVCAIFFSRT